MDLGLAVDDLQQALDPLDADDDRLVALGALVERRRGLGLPAGELQVLDAVGRTRVADEVFGHVPDAADPLEVLGHGLTVLGRCHTGAVILIVDVDVVFPDLHGEAHERIVEPKVDPTAQRNVGKDLEALHVGRYVPELLVDESGMTDELGPVLLVEGLFVGGGLDVHDLRVFDAPRVDVGVLP